MKTNRPIATARPLVVSLLTLIAGVQAATTDLATAPLSGASTTQVFPNILFVLDDSLSMEDDALPDWANGAPLFRGRNASFNGIAYNPAVRYDPPNYFNAQGAADTTTYPSQTSLATNGWQQVQNDGYKIQSTTKADLRRAAFYYTTVAGEYCTDKTLRNCTAATTASTSYPVAAPLRWCNDLAQSLAATPSAGSCRATQTDLAFKYPRMPEPQTSQLTITGTAAVSSITVNGLEILSTVVPSLTGDALASSLEASINACTLGKTGLCATVGYSATANGSVLTISAPNAFADMTPVLTKTGSGTVVATKFGRWGSNQVPGDVTLTVITDPLSSYLRPNSEKRTDCSGTTKDKTCTYEQEMTNYANWWAYYHTRMQTMKSATSISFAKIDETRRIGYMSINNNTNSDFLNISEFSPEQKKNWYDKLFAAVPGKDTPLRVALSTAGYLFAGKYNQQSIYGVSVQDPVQYYCQKNTTILSTDGYWNGAGGRKLDGTDTGDQDGAGIIPLVERPQLDGGAPLFYLTTRQSQQTKTPTLATVREVKTEQLQSDTSQLQVSTLTVPQSRTANLMTRTIGLVDETSQLMAVTAPLQKSTKTTQQKRTNTVPVSTTGQLQKRTKTQIQGYTASLQTRTSSLQFSESTLQTQTATLQTQTYTLQKQTTPLLQTLTQVQQRTSSDSGLNWSGWTSVDTCDRKDSGLQRRQCRTLAATTSQVSSCPVITGYTDRLVNVGTDTETYQSKTGSSCAYGTASGFGNATAACTAQAKSSGGEGSTWVGPAVDCQYSAGSGLVNAAGSCTAVAKSAASPYTVLTARDCQYSGWTALSNAAGTCTPVAPSTGSPYTVQTARNCQYTAYTDWANSGGTCTPVPQDTTNYTKLTARQCRYTDFGAWADAISSCTSRAQDTTSYTVVTARECQYSSYSWQNMASCTVQAASSSPGPYTVLKPISQCQNVWTGWSNASNCTASATVECQYVWGNPVINDASCPGSATGPNYTVQNPKTCSYTWTAWTNGACTPVAGQTECQKDWTAWRTAWTDTGSTCTKTGTYGNISDADGATDCRYGAASSPTPVNSCTTATASSGPTFTVTTARACSYANYVVANGDAAVCATVAQSAASPYTVGVAHRCSYNGAVSDWTTASGNCTATTQNGNNWFGPKRECQYAGWTSFSNDPSCPGSAAAPSTGPSYTVAQAKECALGWTQPPVDTVSCNEDSTHHCTYAAATGWQNVSSCTEAPYDYHQTGRRCQTVVTDWQIDGSLGNQPCEEKTVNNGNGLKTSYRCTIPAPTTQYVAKCGDDPTQSTVTEEPSESNGYVGSVCTTTTSPKNNVVFCSAADNLLPQNCPTTNPEQCKSITCSAEASGATPDTLADVAQYFYTTDLRDPTLNNCASNGDSSKNVCEGQEADKKVQRMTTYTLGLGASGMMQYDPDYPKATQGDGSDFASIKWLTQADPNQGICSWQLGGDCNWPKPASNSQNNIDDLWHAAVNGRGIYFNAKEPNAVAAGISSALADIGSASGSTAAVTVASPNFVAGDNNSIFAVSFEVGIWAGDVVKLTANGDTGAISTNAVWSAEDKLRKKMTNNGVQAADDTLRTIYTRNTGGESVSGAADNLKFFSWSALTSSEKSYFSRDYIDGRLSQFCPPGETNCLSNATKDLASGENLVKFLRGDRTNEGELENLNAYYRQRTTKGSTLHRPLGDIAGSEAVYVQTPPWNYVDKQYAEFKAANKTRKGMVYVGANDGMLHAFDASTGEESWAYIPTVVLPKLYKLADKNYAGLHQFTVDGTPVIGDICVDTAANCSNASSTSVWKTILVGGLNGGGRGYYALDITDPAKPKSLWEFTDDNLGLTYGNPVITKLKDGTWVVIVASGYNNVSPGDGVGRLFILNAKTGAPISAINSNGTIGTGAGSSATPSGLAKITAWANFPDENNTAERVYGGDLLGNLWRFDINGDIGTVASPKVYDAQRLATLKAADGSAQPITTKPELGKIKNYPVIFVGTGKLLGPHDFEPINQGIPKFQKHSFYAIKDKLTDTDYGNPRVDSIDKNGTSVSAFNSWTLASGTCPSNVSFCGQGKTTVKVADLPRNPGETDEEYAARQLTTQQQTISNAFGPYNDGWYIDLPGDGEQSNTDPALVRGTIVFTTNQPQEGGGCSPKAFSFIYFLDYRTGGAIEGTNGIIGLKIGDTLAARTTPAVLPNDKPYGYTRTDDLKTTPQEIPTSPPGSTGRRISWRELLTE